jgi:hypothetical protein
MSGYPKARREIYRAQHTNDFPRFHDFKVAQHSTCFARGGARDQSSPRAGACRPREKRARSVFCLSCINTYHVSFALALIAGFDLGGSTCACVLQWDMQQYWQRIFYGKKYVVFHCTTAFFGVLFLHRPQWVLIWKLLNEVLEELGNAIVGRWAWTVSVLDMESRYDTLINDILLTAVPFSALGLHLVTVLELPNPIPHNATIDKTYLLRFLRIFAQYTMFLQANQSNIWFGDKRWTLGSLAVEAGQLTSCLVQIALIWLLVLLHKLSSKQAGVNTVSICVLWAQFVVHGVDYNGLPVDEQIGAILSFSITGLFICYYQWYIPSQHQGRPIFPTCVPVLQLSGAPPVHLPL